MIQLLQDRPDDPDAKKRIIELGCSYSTVPISLETKELFQVIRFAGLASRYTSFVAVDPKEQQTLNESWMMMKSRDVPVQVAHGWGGGATFYAMALGGPPVGMAYGAALGGSSSRMMRSSAPMARARCSDSSAFSMDVECDSISSNSVLFTEY